MFHKKFIKVVLTILATIIISTGANAQTTPNERQARQMFDKAYNLVFGPQGSRLHYDVNILGLYKTNGTIWYKDKKAKFIENRYLSWTDGVTYYLVDKKKKVVEVHRNDSDDKDQYSKEFKFNPEDYTYNVEAVDEGYQLTLKAKPGKKGMKEIKGIIDRKTYAPKSLKIKVKMIWARIKISDFQSGNIDDSIFIFPKEQYKDYPVVDKRKK